MLYQIASFLLDVLGGLFAGACLLRLYMQWQRVGFANPVGGLVFALTDWLVIPLRRVLVPVGRWDGASLVAALLLQLVQYFLLALMWADSAWTWLPWLALLGLMRVVVSGLTGLLIVHAVLSWVQGRSVLADMLARLSAPLLRPLRRVMPPINGIDFTPLLALVLLQVLMIVLGHLQASVLR
ncbi:YggT family protein [Verminephrobacter eiseniae]|uniref:YggT family protein n=1 Tax=Verminephrobacter eiseniae TaxID=364317 RepID=UPI002237573A|nr:YggT family protein [Verminephrobacter eiseniae]MCW5260812.1 YggT family protein [Verminephrobacter eiseniae]